MAEHVRSFDLGELNLRGAQVVTTIDPVRQRFLLSVVILAVFGVASVWAVMNGTLYDDEIFSVVQVSQKGVSALIQFMNSVDVHPPGAYVINRLLLDVLRRWDLVKMADGIINSFGLSFFFWMAYPEISPRARLYLAFVLATAATLIVWGTSVRWYAYYNPLVISTYAVLLFSKTSRNARTAFLGIVAIILFHINYVTFCAVPTFLALHIAREWRGFRAQPKDLWRLLLVGVVALAVCVPQLIVFVTVHSRTNLPQQGSPTGALLQVLIMLSAGSAVFPIAYFPILVVVALGIGCAFALFKYPLSASEKTALIALLIGIGAMTLTGLGIRPRNCSWLLPLAWLLIATLLAKLPRAFQLSVVLPFVLFQIIGMRNAIAHEGTDKGSYNTDFHAVMKKLHSWQSGCSRFFVFNHDVVLTELVRQAGIPQSSPFLLDEPDSQSFSAKACYVVVKTNNEPFDARSIHVFYRGVESPHALIVSSADISIDPDHEAKSWVTHEIYQAFYVHMDLYRVADPTTIPSWKFSGWSSNSGGTKL